MELGAEFRLCACDLRSEWLDAMTATRTMSEMRKTRIIEIYFMWKWLELQSVYNNKINVHDFPDAEIRYINICLIHFPSNQGVRGEHAPKKKIPYSEGKTLVHQYLFSA